MGPLTLNHSTVSGNNSVYVAGVHNNTDATIVIENGSRITGNTSSGNTGGLGNEGTATVADSNIDSNTAANFGAGINNSGDITVTSSTVNGNTATANNGGGIEMAHGTLTVLNSQINSNSAGDSGGALDSFDGVVTVTMTNTTVSGNSAVQSGGGIYFSVGTSTLTLNRTTLSGNTAGNGGALRSDFGTATISNSTFSGNSASYGGAIYNGENNTATLTNVTISANLASQLGGGIYGPQDVSNTVNLLNTIVADQNTNTDCDGLGFHSLGNNLDSGDNCNLDQPSDRPQTDVFLGPLADNGGPTKTHALLANSNAIDGGNDSVCADDPINGIDQRGEERPSGAHCDIGAFEFDSPTPTPTSSPSPSPTGSPTTTPVRATETWGDNNCDGNIDLQDVERGLIALGLPELLESIAGCPDMGELIDFVDVHPAGAGTLIWGDAYCINGLNGIDVLVVLHYVVGTETIPFTAGFCPDVGDEVVFDTQQ
jgi:predicted outer membrane repeat protein